MVDVNMSSMPSKIIGKEARLGPRALSRLSKDYGLKRHPNNWRKEESKEIRDSVKVEDGSVYRKKYNGHCMKQVKIPKATWTSPILRRRSTCRTSSSKASLMKDDVKVKVPNGTSNTLILCDGVLKSSGKPKGDHVTHFWGWIERPITQNSVWKCSYEDDTIEKGPMMWVSFTMGGNRQEEKWLVVKPKALKWAKANSAPPKGSPWQIPMANGMIMTSPSRLRWL